MTSNGNGARVLERQQDVEQAVAVLAARQADHHAVVRRDEPIVADRLADLPAQALPQLVRLELRLARVARAARPARGALGGAGVAKLGGGRSVHRAPSFYRREARDWR